MKFKIASGGILWALMSSLWSLSAQAQLPFDFGINAGANIGFGQARDENETRYQARSVMTYGVHALPGIRVGPGLIGVFGEFSFANQSKEASALVDSTKISLDGSYWLVGVGGTFTLMDFYFLGSFDFLGQWNLSNKSSTNSRDRRFRKPIGFNLGAGYKFLPMLGAHVIGTYHAYREYKVGSNAAQDLSVTGQSLLHWQVRAGLSFIW